MPQCTAVAEGGYVTQKKMPSYEQFLSETEKLLPRLALKSTVPGALSITRFRSPRGPLQGVKKDIGQLYTLFTLANLLLIDRALRI